MLQSIEDLVKRASIILWMCDNDGIITLQIGGYGNDSKFCCREDFFLL